MLRLLTAFFAIVLLVVLSSAPVQASHTWGNYHWARTANPFTLKLGDNVSALWDPFLSTTSYDWSLSSVINTTIVAGSTNPKNCRPASGRVDVCNARYGSNGWLGIAQIWASGSHITQGAVKMNDTYFLTSKYNTPAWKNLVMCQEVGHTFGLDHQDEDFGNPNLGTCMDYTNNPESNQHPNAHDYAQLEDIYSHLDLSSTLSQIPAANQNGDFNNRSEWGKSLKDNGNVALFMREFGPGKKLFTFVVWASYD
jgi:hypothetical protein